MTSKIGDRHVYLRAIAQGERTSLSVLASMVTAGARVLDLGTGSGALGQHLREHAGCIVDGVTINEQEAALARSNYRRVEVADLEQAGWTSLFDGDQYDFIICADVLEHLSRPENALNACRPLLAAGGQLLISIPNAAYGGLVAELLEGDFTYREEGLLDRTHLRFFTRRSLQLFLSAEGWGLDRVEAIERPVTESEFRGSFDKLPPAVARYLLAAPDAGTYQLVAAARPLSGIADSQRQDGGLQPPLTALYSVQLYLGDSSGFREDRKIVKSGLMGAARQVLRFDLLGQDQPLTALRLDPADRPGFLHLHALRLLAGDQVVWQWNYANDGLAVLQAADHQGMVIRAPWTATVALILLHGDDPRVTLPIPQTALATLAASNGGSFEVELGWPMSADYLALADTVEPLHRQLRAARARAYEDGVQAQRRLDEAVQNASHAAAQARQRIEELSTNRQDLLEQTRLLEAQNLAVMGKNKVLSEEKNLIARHRLALQSNLNELAQQHQALAEHLRWIENSTVFRATRPLVRAKMGLERILGRRAPEAAAAQPQARPVVPPDVPVDIIVPVYRGLADTQLCITSVLASRCKTPWRLVVLNDASPEPEVTQWLREICTTDSRILLLENEENLGFVGTVNRGMSASTQNDALLLNSDTEVANDWLDRLRQAAYGDERVASVTPFSNNATICSYPRFCEPNELPPGCDTASLDRVFAETNAGQAIDVPTGVGFCMYIRRDCLNEVGLFDVEQFGKGYGEENDFCRRAADAGWRNLHALDTFVLHTGGVSFGASKSQRERDAVEKLRRLHPSYDGIVHDFVAADPAWSARHAVDLARVRATGLPCVLAVLHDRGGGTVRHAAELADYLRGRAVFFSLTPAPGAVWLELLEPKSGFRLEFSVPQQWGDLLIALRALGVAHVHYHHVLGHGTDTLGLGQQLGVSWDFTAHDFYAMCPQISLTDRTDRYCGEEGEGQCGRCLDDAPAPGGLDIRQWRQRHGVLLAQARHVLVPSMDTGRRFVRMWPSSDVRLAPHTDIADVRKLPSPAVRPLDEAAPLRIVVIGALSRIKGADLLEDVASLAAKGSDVEFHLIGHAYRPLHKQPRAALTVHGAYQEDELADLLAWLKPDLVWFPALWPETYSYTLSACLLAGLPVVAPDLGAFPERLSGRKWSWIRSWNTPAAQWLAFFTDVRQHNFMTGTSPTPYLSIASSADERIGRWSYDNDYLVGLRRRGDVTDVLDAPLLNAHRPGGGEGLERQRRRIKQRALSLLVRLRALPALRQLVRAIPLRWQTRVKSWLRT